MGRLESLTAEELRLTNREERLKHNPATPGKKQGDDAGHLIADRFGGSPELDNLVSQMSSVNRGIYRRHENRWAKAIEQGKKVQVKIRVLYNGDELRPSGFNIDYKIDGKEFDIPIISNN